MKSTVVYLGLGSNLGDRERNLRQALDLLCQQVTLYTISPIYETAPEGDGSQPRYLNLVCKARTKLPPEELLKFAKGIEAQMGREPGPRNSPRPIDIDILFYGNMAVDTPELTIPHPHAAERAFVLIPLVNIAPRLRHPVSGKTVTQLVKKLKRTEGDAERWAESESEE
ncbi:MAG: 2-amino-4-hydroxy-6-hydroxymethyldihydropteridine diphosphokinase [Dehalococcoidia bacterium]|nr:2-amino-4-hydroxy-6-hydroxymethyldihydropteridine diphosphokinase [Dehalococcoidia bacterium]